MFTKLKNYSIYYQRKIDMKKYNEIALKYGVTSARIRAIVDKIELQIKKNNNIPMFTSDFIHKYENYINEPKKIEFLTFGDL